MSLIRFRLLKILVVSLMPFTAVMHALALTPSEIEAKQSKALATFAKEHLLGEYSELRNSAETLRKAVHELINDPNQERVLNARDAWRLARSPWEKSEAFLFGPVDTEGHDPNLDSWPVNLGDLKKIVSPSTSKNQGFDTIDHFDEGVKGFHVIELLLFANFEGKLLDAEGQVAFLKLHPHAAMYLGAVADAFSQQAAALYLDYASEGKNFSAEIAGAGQSSEIYPTRKAAFQEIINASVGILDEIAETKLGEPSQSGDAALLESRFSANTLQDVKDNVAGVRMVYESAFAPWLTLHHEEIAKEYQAHLGILEDAVTAIPKEFSQDPKVGKKEVEKAMGAAQKLSGFLSEKLWPVLP